MTDTLTVGSITQLTETGSVTRFAPGTRLEVVFGTLPDPRDARIAQLEAALREIYAACDDWPSSQASRLDTIRDIVSGALVTAPERDMNITQEDLPA